MHGAYLLKMWKQAVRDSKDAVVVVRFGNRIRATITIERDVQ